MIVAQGLNKIYLTIAQSIARFGRFFCVELLRFNTCGYYILAAANYLFGVSFPSRQEQFLGEGIPRKAGESVRDTKTSSRGIGRGLGGTKQGQLVSANLNRAANILRGMYRRLDIELVGAGISKSSLESQNICKPTPARG
jgi:hypothetical protein